MERTLLVSVRAPGEMALPDPDAVHLMIEAAEATGRLLLCRAYCGCGELDGTMFQTSAEELWQCVDEMLDAHPQARRLVILRPPGLGPRDGDYARWALGRRAVLALPDRTPPEGRSHP